MVTAIMFAVNSAALFYAVCVFMVTFYSLLSFSYKIPAFSAFGWLL